MSVIDSRPQVSGVQILGQYPALDGGGYVYRRREYRLPGWCKHATAVSA